MPRNEARPRLAYGLYSFIIASAIVIVVTDLLAYDSPLVFVFILLGVHMAALISIWSALRPMPGDDAPKRFVYGLSVFIIAWAIFTVLTAWYVYPLLLTVPILVVLVTVLLAIRWVDPPGFDIVYCILAALALLSSVIWFVGHADERPLEGLAAGFFAVCSAGILWSLRRPARSIDLDAPPE